MSGVYAWPLPKAISTTVHNLHHHARAACCLVSVAVQTLPCMLPKLQSPLLQVADAGL